MAPPPTLTARLSRITPIAWQTAFLFGIDGLTNAVDYGFHVYMGRVLSPRDFAIVQTINAVLLIVLTTCAVLQPVVTKYVAEFSLQEDAASKIRGVFRSYFVRGSQMGLFLMALAWLNRAPIGAWLNVPAAAIVMGAPVLALAVVRPVVFGMLQGQQQFLAYGWTRAAFAFGRLAIAFLLVGVFSGGAIGGITSIFLGTALSFGIGLLWLGRDIWQPSGAVPPRLMSEGWRLSVWALLAYAAYMSLLNSDVIWVNRTFAPDVAGSYAAAALFRRILSLLPGVVLVILYPRIVAGVARGQLPDPLLARAGVVILTPTLALTALYSGMGTFLVEWLFGARYPAAAPLLGWMGVAMTGYGIAGIWLNLFLATRPFPFVVLLAGVAGVQSFVLSRGVSTLLDVTLIVGVGGWVLAIGGFFLYSLWLRPRLQTAGAHGSTLPSEPPP